MTELGYTYSYKEYGWVSEMKLTGNIILLVSFEDKAFVTIRQQRCGESEESKSLVSSAEKDFEITIKKDACDIDLSIITSKKPKFIRYAYI